MKEDKENPVRYMPDESDIDELLNGFIDGELTPRQQTEVQRLITHDERIARRLNELKRCKMLVNALPRAAAPPEMLDKIKAAIEKRTLLTRTIIDREFVEQAKGAKYLLVRRALAVAAMVGLVAILAAIIYTIVAPEEAAKQPVVVKPWPIRQIKPSEAGPAMVGAGFVGTLKLKTTALSAVNAFISRAIEDNDYCIRQTDKEKEGEYHLICNRQGLNLLLADLDSIWDRLDWATLFVDTEQIGKPIVIEQVTVEQIAEIAKSDTLRERIRVAKDFARLNNMVKLLPGNELLIALNDRSNDLIPIPKPVLTSRKKVAEKPISPAKDQPRIYLTIVVTDNQ